jgi:tetratricopeptide (TPR) repeat protein
MTLAKQDERQRVRRRLQDYAIELANSNEWLQSIEINRQILELGEDPQTYNRLGKSYTEMGLYEEAQDAYQQTLRINPTNTIARRNLSRLEVLLSRGYHLPGAEDRPTRQVTDLRLFITEAGKTVITSLVDVPRGPTVEALSAGDRVQLQVSDQRILVLDTYENLLGRLEPRLGQRLAELINGGNRYVAAVVKPDPRQVRILIRETYQDPSQHGRTSFPGRMREDEADKQLAGSRYDYEVEELLEDEEIVDEPEILNTDFDNSDDQGEIGLDQIEKDISDDDENSED